jgi:hypothetical protein
MASIEGKTNRTSDTTKKKKKQESVLGPQDGVTGLGALPFSSSAVAALDMWFSVRGYR